jgi:4-diphosphocytidyl-2-C-methyl-D-erythritol kinase
VTAPVTLTAPAKLTVSLRVQGRRTDGYHDLDAEMVAIDLADTLVVDPSGDELVIEGDRRARVDDIAPGGENLVSRALAAVGRRAAVRLFKRIPVRGGLGGGSSDAAAILRWAGCTDPIVATALGADVPFCVVGGRARVTGVGDRVVPLPHEVRDFVLLVPPVGTDTGAVYRAWDELGAPGGDGPNDLTAAALAVEPRLGAWRDALAEATGGQPVLAGSGSTWYVEGSARQLGIEGRRTLAIGGEQARLIAARTVPRGWCSVG